MRNWNARSAGPRFCVTVASDLRPLSYDNWRKTLSQHFHDKGIGTHSLRKGGTKWFSHVAKVPEDVVQAQGGWASKDVMQMVYSKLSDEERAVAISKAASTSIT